MVSRIFSKVFYLIVIFTLFFTVAWAQRSATDSLQVVVSGLPADTAKVNVMIRLANEYFWSGKYDKALETAAAANELSTQLSFLSGQGHAMTVSGQSKVRIGDYDEAQEFFSKAIEIFKAFHNTIEIANNHLYLGQVYDFKAKYNMALEEYRVAHDIAAHVGDSVVLTKILNSTGITNFNKGNYEVALEHYLAALKMTPLRPGNEKVYATITNNIGVVHVQLQQYEDALMYFHRYVEHMKALKGTHGLGVGYLNIGETYKKLAQFDKAIFNLTEASLIQLQTGDKKGLALSYSNMGDVFKAQREWKKASGKYNEAIALAREIKNDEVLLHPLTGIGELYVTIGSSAMAQQSISEALQVAKEIGSKPWLERSYLISSKLDSARGDFKGAYSWYKKYSSLSDSLFNEQKSKQVVQMKELYESERKDKEIRLLSESNKLSQLQQTNSNKLFAITLAFLAIVILIILYWLVQKTRHSKILKRQKDALGEAHKAQKQLIEKIEFQKAELAQKNEDLLQLHREKDGLIGVVVHDLRSPLNRIFGLSHLVSLSGSVNEEQEMMLGTINKVCEEGNRLIADLLEINEVEGVKAIVLENINVKDLVQEHIVQFNEQLTKKNIQLLFESSTPRHIYAATHAHYLKRILDNLISNAIKFSPAGKRIWVTLSHNGDAVVQLTIRDEGPGFSNEDLGQLFQKFRKLSARPTGGESSTGLGLSIVKLLIDKLGGSITVKSTQGDGAMFIIAFAASDASALEVSAVTGFVDDRPVVRAYN